MNNTLVVVDRETLQGLINDAVFAALQNYKRRDIAEARILAEEDLSDAMNAEDTLRFLASVGRPTSMRGLYGLVYRNAIPYAKFGQRRLVFSRRELRKWAAEQINRPRDRDAEAAQRLAKYVDDSK